MFQKLPLRKKFPHWWIKSPLPILFAKNSSSLSQKRPSLGRWKYLRAKTTVYFLVKNLFRKICLLIKVFELTTTLFDSGWFQRSPCLILLHRMREHLFHFQLLLSFSLFLLHLFLYNIYVITCLLGVAVEASLSIGFFF